MLSLKPNFAVLPMLCLVAASPSIAQEDHPSAFNQGKALYEENCMQCHQPEGEGIPPSFPALDGNAKLEDPELIATQIRIGKNAMPAFPDLTIEEIAALATYIRTAWSNSFGPVTSEDVEAAVADLEQAEAAKTIWDGVYAEEQAENARLLYLGGCAPCHGNRLNGAPSVPDMSPGPPLAGTIFLREWDGRTVSSLFELARATMPVRNPGQFSDQQYIDLIAYILSYNDAPAGDAPLTPDVEVLNDIVITRDPVRTD